MHGGHRKGYAMSELPVVTIADDQAVKNRVDELRNRDQSIKSRLGPTLKGLWNPRRQCAVGAMNYVFDSLLVDFPNFTQVINYWRVRALVSRRTNTPFYFQPVLLGGPPGLGKTYFASEAAKAMSLYFDELSLASLSGGFLISGMNIQWAEGSPGFVAKSLSKSVIANPLLLIDEIDKASRYRDDSLGSFFTLFENHTASRFKDEAIEVELNASYINWVVTANDLDQIPEPLISRMKCFQIEKPSADAMVNVVKSIYKSLHANTLFSDFLDPELPEDTIHKLATHEPRTARHLLENGCMNAISLERRVVTESDIEFSQISKKSIGFIGG